MKISIFDRVLLLAASLLAAYQVAIGIDNFSTPSIIAFSIGFGVLLVAGLLLIILGFEGLDSPVVVIVSTLIPLSLATGLVWEFFERYRAHCLVFAVLGFLTVTITRTIPLKGKLSTVLLAVVHGIAGIIIFLLPIIMAVKGYAYPGFALVGVGGALIGIGGMLLSLLKLGKPILSKEVVLKMLPGLLFLMTACFVVGFSFL